jgi:large subunit ribosomal protein L13
VDTNSYKTYSAKASDIKKKWVLVDAEDQALGRVATTVATYLRGKHKPEFTPHMDTGDNVVVINASKVKLTGNKLQQKEYFRYSGYPGGERFTTAEDMLADKPEFLIKNAVKGMLPKNKLGNKLMTNLRVYAGPVHEQEAQQPEKIDLL